MIGIVVFPSTNCDRDVWHVLKDVLKVGAERIWHKDSEYKRKIREYECIILAGGFSYGDYLRTGAIAAKSPLMDEIKTFAAEGKPVLGICNGFQILCESGLLEGSLSVNNSTKFICKWVNLRVENSNNLFTRFYRENSVIKMPIAHFGGRYVADEKTLKRLNQNDQVIIRYCDEQGEISPDSNPNGSFDHIAGISNEKGNVLGLMPHPERASESILGGIDGLNMFKGMYDFIDNFK